MSANERTNWRDEKISSRHRMYGFDCPAIDIDFLLMEYNKRVVSAIIEYKNEHCKKQNINHPSYHALIDLGNKAGVPVMVVIYDDDITYYKVYPINEIGRQFLHSNFKKMSELEYVQLLHELRGLKMPEYLLEKLHK